MRHCVLVVFAFELVMMMLTSIGGGSHAMPMMSSSSLPKELPLTLGSVTRTIQYLGEGNNGVAYSVVGGWPNKDGKDVDAVAKTSKGEKITEKELITLDKIDQLLEHGDDSTGRHWVIIRKITGKPLRETTAWADLISSKNKQKCTEELAKIRQMIMDDWRYYVAEKKIAHGDINYGNVLFADDLSKAYLIDWGIHKDCNKGPCGAIVPTRQAEVAFSDALCGGGGDAPPPVPRKKPESTGGDSTPPPVLKKFGLTSGGTEGTDKSSEKTTSESSPPPRKKWTPPPKKEEVVESSPPPPTTRRKWGAKKDDVTTSPEGTTSSSSPLSPPIGGTERSSSPISPPVLTKKKSETGFIGPPKDTPKGGDAPKDSTPPPVSSSPKRSRPVKDVPPTTVVTTSIGLPGEMSLTLGSVTKTIRYLGEGNNGVAYSVVGGWPTKEGTPVDAVAKTSKAEKIKSHELITLDRIDQLLEHGDDNTGRHWVVIRKIDGKPLQDTNKWKSIVSAKNKPKCLEELVKIRQMIMDDWRYYVTEKKIAHGDINAGNVLFADDLSKAYLIDWGIHKDCNKGPCGSIVPTRQTAVAFSDSLC